MMFRADYRKWMVTLTALSLVIAVIQILIG